MGKPRTRTNILIAALICCLFASVCATAKTIPTGNPKGSTAQFDSLVAEGSAKLLALMKANQLYEANGQRDKLQYVVTVGFGAPSNPGDSTFFQRNASGATGYFEAGNLVHTIISDSLRKWNLTSTVKCYMLYVNGLFFVLDKETKVDKLKDFFEQPDAGFVLNTSQLKVAHADITNAIFNRVATTDLLRRTTVLFSIGAYRTNAVFMKRVGTNGVPTDSTWVKTHLLLTAYPKAGNLGEADERKKLITIVHNAMLYEKPAFGSPQAALNDERMAIGSGLKRLQKHKQVLVSTTPDELDGIFKDFELADYMALTLPERVHALKVMAGSAMGNNMYNSREAYAVLMVRHTPDAQQQGLLDALITEKAAGSGNVLLKDLVSRIDNGHFVNESNDLDEFVQGLAKFIYLKKPPSSRHRVDSLFMNSITIGIKPGFWFGDDVYQNMRANGVVRLENRERRVTLELPAYDYVYVVFNGNFTIGDETFRKDQKALVPAIVAQLVFNNHNASKIKTGLKTVFDLALLLTGVGELRLALEAKNAWTVAKAVWNIGWATSDFFINGVLAEKLAETESGRRFLTWYNRVQLVAGGMGLGMSIYDIRQGFKQSKQEFADDLADNKLRRELEYGTSEVQVTNAEKDDIINNLKKEEDEVARKLNIIENGYKTVTKAFVKEKLPTDFVDALKSFGKTEDEILDYFVSYHNGRSSEQFFNDIEYFMRVKNAANLTKEETYALWSYTTNLYFRDMNLWLRNGENAARTEKIKNLLNSALSKMPDYGGQFVYRGIVIEQNQLDAFLASYSNGSVRPWNEFTSCGGSLEASFAGRQDVNILFQIEHKTGKNITDLSDGIKYGVPPMGEPEVLIKAGSNFKVVSQPQFNNALQKWVIKIEQIN